MSSVDDPHAASNEGPSWSSGTSPSLIARVRADDPGAWQLLVTLYAPWVAYWCRRWRLGAEDAADVFQDVFQSVALHISRFRREERKDTFRGWLRRITLNKIHDHHRRHGHEPRGVGGSEAWQRMAHWPSPDESASSIESIASEQRSVADAAIERQLLRKGLERIQAMFEPRTWQAFWATAVEGRSAVDVAHDLAMSPGAVRVAKSRVLQRLRTELGDVEG